MVGGHALTVLFQTDFTNPADLNYFDLVGPRNHGESTGSYAALTTSKYHSEPNSMELYQRSPPKTSADRKVGLYRFDAGAREIFMEWFAYLGQSNLNLESWQNLGTVGLNYYPSGANRFFYNKVINFNTYGKTRRKLLARRDDIFVAMTDPPTSNTFTGIYIDQIVSQWTKFGLYLKLAEQGVEKWFVNDQLVHEWHGLTAPEFDPRWDSQGCDYTYGVGNINTSIKTYTDYSEPQHWVFIDDVTVSDSLTEEPPPEPPPITPALGPLIAVALIYEASKEVK